MVYGRGSPRRRHHLTSRPVDRRPWTASGSSGDGNSGVSENDGNVAAETEALAAGGGGGNGGGSGGEMQARKVCQRSAHSWTTSSQDDYCNQQVSKCKKAKPGNSATISEISEIGFDLSLPRQKPVNTTLSIFGIYSV